MHENFQKTITKPVKLKGIGLHTGQQSQITIYPGEANEGIIFKRTDLKENNLIEANFQNVSSAKLCTTLENKNGIKVSTVEHLLAAFYISGIDNALVEINCEEVPIMDGSAKEFLRILSSAEITTLSEKRKYLKISKKLELVDGKRKISIEPNNNSLEVDFQLDYENRLIGKQKNIVDFQKDDLKDVSVSRTFCLFEDIEKIKKAGLAKGGSLENAIVIKENKVLNEGGLRNEKEFVNHKILDLAGDFLLSGYRVIGRVKCVQGGHELTNMFLRKLFKDNSILSSIENSRPLISDGNVIKPSIKIAVSA
jgi:UDP-3-O-[3-hydroxymyristoyl] N-acetylglucosamine deacetylase|tara:strand:- start:328 stop:1254 length:927 start_codon:yes stop_codon:yes gene_type:complete